MIELLHALRDFLTNKVAVYSAAAVAPVAAFAPAGSTFIDLAASGWGPLSWAGWIAFVSFLYVFTNLLEKWGAFRLAKWLWEKLRARNP